ncbi:MAG TPA: zinc-ribbon domain containing protein [Thermoguttaceae bacterium]|nr:zinc-ribbon domain containing protein [Thermoguttaceae bacterium]
MTKRRREMREKKAACRRRKLESHGLIVDGVEIPPGAIPANTAQQAPAGYSRRYYYKDLEFTCVDCGAEEIWTAEDQQWYFEVIKAHPLSTATHCSECRKKRKAAKAEQRRRMDASADRSQKET